MVKIKSKKTKAGIREEVKIELTEQEILRRIEQIESLLIDDDLRNFLIGALKALIHLDKLVGLKETTIARLRKIFNKKMEKTNPSPPPAKNPDAPHPRGNNKGRNGKNKFPNSPDCFHPHATLKKGDICPECGQGTIADYTPGLYIRITGSPPLNATIHKTEKFRCTACQFIFEAHFDGKDKGRYDARAVAILALLKFRASMPYYRLEKIQKHFATPLPASTQWDLMEGLANLLQFLWWSLINKAASGKLFFVDDTKVKILDLMMENKRTPDKKKGFRKGMFTTGILSEVEGQKIMLYFTGRKHAGENLKELLDRRAGKDIPTVMSDALPANRPKDHEVNQALCNAHSRRKFFDLGEQFKEETTYVLDLLKKVFKNEAETKERGLDNAQRLLLHQEKSLPLMEDLKSWMIKMVEEKKVEPNSGLGKSFQYVQKNWHGLTAFTRVEGAPVDNNLLEEKLRLPILNKKNWLFYKTQTGALVGDIVMSVIKTAEEAEVDPFEYLVWLQENASEVKKDPEKFYPWNFKRPPLTE